MNKRSSDPPLNCILTVEGMMLNICSASARLSSVNGDLEPAKTGKREVLEATPRVVQRLLSVFSPGTFSNCASAVTSVKS
jgi:hypothetical protein